MAFGDLQLKDENPPIFHASKNIVNWARSGIIEILCGRDLSTINMDPKMNALEKKTLLLLDIMARVFCILS